MSKILLAKGRRIADGEVCLVQPLGLLYLAAALREAGHQVRLYDAFDEPGVARYEDLLRSFRPDVVGLSALTWEARAMARLAASARRLLPGVPVVVGGPHATAYPERCLAVPEVDLAVAGEGDRSFVELVAALTGAGDPRDVPGVISRREDGTLRTNPRPAPIDVDELPLPAWDLLDLERYGRLPSMWPLGPRPYMAVSTSRGCPYQCLYCHNLHGKRYRGRSPERVVEELRALHERYGLRDVELVDDTFNLDRERALAILEGIARLPFRLRLSFPNGVRADRLDPQLMEAFHRAGTFHIAFAIESAAPRVQELIGKRLDLDEAARAIRHAARLGMFTSGFFILGFPTETLAEARETLRFARRSPLHQAVFLYLAPYAGTELAERYAHLFRERGVPDAAEDFNFFAPRANLSAMPDSELFGLQQEGYRRFYLDPVRFLRILRRHPRRDQVLRQGASDLVKMLPLGIRHLRSKWYG